MSGGSVTQDDRTDQRCEHCKRWFSAQGLTNHEPNCSFRDVDLQEYVEELHEQFELSGQDFEKTVEVEQSHSVEQQDGEVPETSASDSDSVDGTTPNTQSTATDGGPGLGLDGPPAAPDRDASDDVDQEDDLEDDVDERETIDCPHCDTDTELTADEHDDGTLYKCDECGGTYKWV